MDADLITEGGHLSCRAQHLLLLNIIYIILLISTTQLIASHPRHYDLQHYPAPVPPVGPEQTTELVEEASVLQRRLILQEYIRDLGLPDLSILKPTDWVQSAHKSQTDKKCENTFGLPFLQDWRVQHDEWCQSDSNSLPHSGSVSRIVSHPKAMPTDFFPTSEHRRERLKRNVALELYNITLTSTTYSVFEAGKFGDPKPMSGSVMASCTLDQNAPSWAFNSVRGASELIQSAMQDGQERAVRQACTLGTNKTAIVEHPVLFLYRYDTTNSYHNMENVLAVFATLAMLDSPLINQQGLEVQMGCVIRYC
jgi:hypothetical protein